MSAALTFMAPPPGLAPLVDFTLEGIDGAEGLYALQASAADKRLFVLDAAMYAPGYSPAVSEEQASGLNLNAPADAMVLVVANPGEGGITVNLMAPILVNPSTGACAQVILEGQDWPLRAELSTLAGSRAH